MIGEIETMKRLFKAILQKKIINIKVEVLDYEGKITIVGEDLDFGNIPVEYSLFLNLRYIYCMFTMLN